MIENVVAILQNDSILSKAQNLDLCRLLPHVSEKTFEAGQVIYRAGDQAQNFYLLIKGNVELVSQQGDRIAANGHFGEESGTDSEFYINDAYTRSAVTTMVIPRSELVRTFETSPDLRVHFYFSMINLFSNEKLQRRAGKIKKKKEAEWPEIIGWLLAVVIPAAGLYWGPKMGLEMNATIFLAIFSATMVMWIFKLMDEYAPGLFALLATLIMGISPPQVILSGFISDGFFMAMSVLGLGTVIVASGLSYRCLLMLLFRLPRTHFWMNAGLLLTGFLLTPILPTANGRVALVKPFMTDMVETLHFKPKGKSATRLAVAAFTGVTLLSGVFLTSKSVNFVVFGMLSGQGQDQFQWLNWLYASLVPGFVMLIVYLISVALMFRSSEQPQLSREQINTQLKLMGRLKNAEWAAIAGVVIFMVGVVTYSFHKVQPPWVGLAILYGLMLFGFFRKKEFKETIDWPFLVYLASTVGIIATFNSVGLGRILTANLAVLGEYMRTNFELFVLILFVITFVIRLAVPISATIVIMATVFMPIAEVSGVNPWVVGFIILLLGEMWVFPYQCSYYMQFQPESSREAVYDEKAFLRYNMFMNLIKLAAVYAAIPYWKMLGLL